MIGTSDNAGSRPTRLFVGVKIAPDIAAQLAAIAAPLKDARARLVAPEDVHLTLVPPWQETSTDLAIDRLQHASRGFTPCSLRFGHVGYGPEPGHPRLLWVDCAAADELAALRAALMTAFGQEDARPFRPHVTLARLRENGRRVARKFPVDQVLELVQPVSAVELFQSPPPGAKGYRILASAPLSGPVVPLAIRTGRAEQC